MRLVLILLLFGLLLAPSTGAAAESTLCVKAPTVAGFWLTEDSDAVVEIYRCKDKFCGRFHWLKDDSAEDPSLDDKNNDPEKRHRPLCGLQFMGGFKAQDDGHFTSGWIYSPRHGAMFSAQMTLMDADTLDLHGYMLIPFFGQSQIWHRTENLPMCGARQG